MDPLLTKSPYAERFLSATAPKRSAEAMAHDAPPSPELDDRTIETAIALDIDPFAEDHLLWIARSAQNDAELPPGWHRCTLADLSEGYANPALGVERPDHPRAEEFRVLVAQERRRTAARAHRPHPEQPRKRARTTGIASGGGGGDENATSRVGKTLHADARVAAMEASHRIALKGLQRKVCLLYTSPSPRD